MGSEMCIRDRYKAEAEERGQEIDLDDAREIVYGMPYSEWKEKYQQEATSEQKQEFQRQNQSH